MNFSKQRRSWRSASRGAAAGLALLCLSATTALAQSPITPMPAVGGEKVAAKNLLTVIHDGGPLMYPILLCSFVMMIFVFERFIALRRGRVIPGPFVKRFLIQLREGQIDREKALALCDENGSPVAVVFAAAMKKWGRPGVEVEQAILDSGERLTNQLRKHIRLFNGIAQIGPLLGLVGTVIGMIISFNGLASSGQAGQREALASGIGQALLTTAAGMLVAIPAIVFYLYFIGRVDQLIQEIDGLGQQIVEIIAGDSYEKELAKANRKKAA